MSVRNDPCPCGSGRKYKKCHGQPRYQTVIKYMHEILEVPAGISFPHLAGILDIKKNRDGCDLVHILTGLRAPQIATAENRGQPEPILALIFRREVQVSVPVPVEQLVPVI